MNSTYVTPQRNVLMIAFHFPPCAVSSGIQRTLSFARYLPVHGWRPVVLSAASGAYEKTSTAQLKSIPDHAVIARAPALDAARHFALRGRYLSRLALPDRWNSWKFCAVPLGLWLTRRHAIDAIWSTYPISTAHVVASRIAQLTRIPWIADFRDPMVEHVTRLGLDFPRDPRLRKARLEIEERTVKLASKLVFCTQGAADIVRERYPDLDDRKICIISNGYDESEFSDAVTNQRRMLPEKRVVLLHSGTIYMSEDRDPVHLFRAIQDLATRGVISSENFELRLRNPAANSQLLELINEFGIGDLVKIAPSISYTEALAEMLNVDGLLILQGHTSNPAVPAKLYEYLRAGTPIVALIDDDGETAASLRSAGRHSMADITDSAAIAKLIQSWFESARPAIPAQRSFAPPPGIDVFSRERLTEKLAHLLEGLSSREHE
jgi:glycosyltransferase involved in cell wall biosynthesis